MRIRLVGNTLIKTELRDGSVGKARVEIGVIEEVVRGEEGGFEREFGGVGSRGADEVYSRYFSNRVVVALIVRSWNIYSRRKRLQRDVQFAKPVGEGECSVVLDLFAARAGRASIDSVKAVKVIMMRGVVVEVQIRWRD